MIQGALLVAGAIVLAVTVGTDRLPFYWTPVTLGVTYLLAATVDGPRGGYWATAIGLTGWGLAVLYVGKVRPPDVDTSGAYLVGVGVAVAVAAALRNKGFLISDLGLGITIAGAGLTLALTPRVEALDDANTYAIALGLVGALNLAGGLFQLVRGRRAP